MFSNIDVKDSKTVPAASCNICPQTIATSVAAANA